MSFIGLKLRAVPRLDPILEPVEGGGDTIREIEVIGVIAAEVLLTEREGLGLCALAVALTEFKSLDSKGTVIAELVVVLDVLEVLEVLELTIFQRGTSSWSS